MLTDVVARKAEKREKAYKLYDSGGLHLVIASTGGKLWRMKYQFGGKEKLLSFGPYPEVTLAAARYARDDARAQLRAGKDPSVAKKIRKLEAVSGDGTFETIAREWYALNKEQWVARHAADVIESLEAEVFPTLGGAPIRDISAADVLACLRPIEKRGAKETARRIRQRMSAVFVYAVASDRADNDPAAMVKKAMTPMKKGKQPAITDLDKAREMLAKAESETAHPVTKLALRILALTAVRPGTLAATPWAEWPAGGDLWQIPAERMKLRLQHKDDEARDHFVPLSRQTIEAIDALRTISGRGPLAFPNTRHAHKPMSENAIGYLLNRAGYHSKHVPHGWRATFSSVMNEGFRPDKPVIDLMLAHTPKDKVEGAYNRALHLERRKELAQIWADLILEGARPAAELLVGPRR
ncbi:MULTISPECIES: integrase arm-type DNA-binding domain-containing protein [unclassified Mesorhizobium]|uniref:tyrosine-type recombinase/integrase n=1 Tax=unclassified Mesorhizobium TaxID=325217 RepID=UPI00241572A9|nr:MULTISPECIES: integrase arm-type DNA-binding domain-containing protein [unclassified Mesorhizobium]MDG4854084.1 integrase arm-type DNA-binding domain-containing protein [Mesorhizobium sp. WSM4982]MDG4910900.1 integrase arm-type DNA-binding domain-containing protein [Mesorhizobium sp. WSM4983]